MIKCPVCQSEKNVLKSVDSREGIKLNIYSCRNCGHHFQNPKVYKELYTTGEFSQIARSSSNVPSTAKIKELDRRARVRMGFYEEFIKPQSKILEIGSSIGSFVSLLKLAGHDASGLEPDQDYAEFSKKQYGFAQSSELLENYQTDGRYDLICSFHVIEHVKYPRIFLEKIHQLLNSKGKVILEMPSYELHSYGSTNHMYWTPHIHYFSLSSLNALLQRYFKVEYQGFIGNALVIVGTKKEEESKAINQTTINSLKLRSTFIYWFVHLFPLPGFRVTAGKIPLKQLVLQSFLQKNRSQLLNKFIVYGSFFFKNRFYLRKEKKKSRKNPVPHFSYFSAWENAGDTVLSQCVRVALDSTLSSQWNLKKVTNSISDELVAEMNNSKAIVVGGGGLFVPDSNPNSISGWQMPISAKQLTSLTRPLIVYAVGYNYFRGQEPNKLFENSLELLVKQSSFFSLRNYGSIRAVNELTQSKYKDKILHQPCPTTVIRQIYKKLPPKVKSKNIAINVAFDRYDRRFGGNMHGILAQLSAGIKKLEREGFKIYCANHLETDGQFEYSLKAQNVRFKSIDLQLMTPIEVYKFYNNMELVIGMRGHAQMIPFGLNTKILSIGTHDKLRFFLEDINALDWYIDVQNNQTLEEQVTQKSLDILNDLNVDEKLISEQEKLFQITQDNLETIKTICNG